MYPKIIVGLCRESYDTSKPLSKQTDDVWCMSLFSGDKFYKKKWRKYYSIDVEEKVIPPKFGWFEVGSVIGVMLDMDRGYISFFKDGNDLGQAFVEP
jgi:hypothetical protein